MKSSMVGHSRPASITWTVSTSFLTDSDALTDGKPARVTRIDFGEGSPAITDYVDLAASWTTPKVIRCAQMIFQGRVPAGVKIEVRGKRSGDSGHPYALGGNALTQRTVERDDGTVMIQWVFADGLDALVGIQFRIFDDANGATFGDEYIDVGEVFFGEGTEVNIRREFADEIEDPSLFEQSIGNQPHVVERKRAKVIRIEVCPTPWDAAYMSGDSLARLRERLVGKRDCILVTAFREPATGGGAIEYDVVQQTSWFGKCTDLGALQSVPEGPRWTVSLTFRESPGRIVA